MFRKTKKTISIFMVLVMLIGIMPMNVFADYQNQPHANESTKSVVSEKFVSDDNGYIKYFVNRDTGGFYILPSIQPFDESKPPSFGSFRINGVEYIFGGNYPNSEFILPPIINHGRTCQTVWRINEVYVTQFLNIIKNDASENSYAVYIRYEAESAYEETELDIDFEGRILLDTMFGANDELPVSTAGNSQLFTNETSISGYDIPMFFGTNDSFEVSPRAYALINNDKVTTPSTITLASFSVAVNTIFDYAYDDTRSFAGDSSILLYFEGYPEDNGNLLCFSTIYGFDDLILATETHAFDNQDITNSQITLLSDNGVTIEVKNDIGTNGALKGRYLELSAVLDKEDNSATWNLDGNTSNETNLTWSEWSSNYAELYVSIDEEAKSLFITATSASDPTKSATVEIDVISPYTATVTSVGEGFKFSYFSIGGGEEWLDSLEDEETVSALNYDNENKSWFSFFAGEKVMVAFELDYETLQYDDYGNPIQLKAIENLIIKDANGVELEYRTANAWGNGLYAQFEMPASDVTIDLVSSEARRIEKKGLRIGELSLVYAEKNNNPFDPLRWGWTNDNPVFSTGNEVTIYVNLYTEATDLGLQIKGVNSLHEYPLRSHGVFEYEDMENRYLVYSFVMPDEDVILDFIYYTATVASVGEGFEFPGFWVNDESGASDGFYSSSNLFYHGENVYVDFHQNPDTFDNEGNPTKAIKEINFITGNSYTNDVDYLMSFWEMEGGSYYLLNFYMPNCDTEVELVTADARKIETAVQMAEEFNIVYRDKYNSPFDNWWGYNSNPVFAAGQEIKIYAVSRYGMIPGDVSIVGKRTSQAYALIERETLTDWESGANVYVYTFVMPDEDVTFTGTHRLDENYKFQITPDIQSNRGQLGFSGEGIVIDGNIASILPGQKVSVDITGIDHVHHDFHGVSVSSVRNGVEFSLVEEIPGQRYSFIMPATHVYVHLDVRQKPTYAIDTEIDRTAAGLTLKNERNGATNSGYAGDRITFNITNRDIKRVFESVQLLNAGTHEVIQTFDMVDVYADNYSNEFMMPPHGVVVQVLFENTPPIPVIVSASIPSGTNIKPEFNQVLFGDTVHFSFTTNDGRYLKYRPVLRALDSNGNLIYHEHYQNGEDLTNENILTFESGVVRKTGGIPASIEIDVYEIPFSYTKELVSIKPNSTQAELFNEIIVTGRNLYEGDEGIVYIGSSIHSMQPAIITSFSFDTIRIHVPENMRPVDGDVTYFVRINDVEDSCTIIFDRRLRSEPFGLLAVVSDNEYRHSVIIADREEELKKLAGDKTITLRMIGKIRYNLSSDTYEFYDGNVLINGFVTYSIAENNVLSVRETHRDELQKVYGVNIFGARGDLEAGGKKFVKNNSIEINLQHLTKYIDEWAKNPSGSLIKMGEENIIIEYTIFDAGFAIWSNGIVGEASNAVLLSGSIIESGKGYIGFGLASGIEIKEGSDWFKQLVAVDVQRVKWAPNTEGGKFVFQGIEAQGKADLPEKFLTNFHIFGFDLANAKLDVFVNSFDGIAKIESEVKIPKPIDAKLWASLGFDFHSTNGFPLDSFYFMSNKAPNIELWPPFASLTGYGGGASGLAKPIYPGELLPWRLDLFGIVEIAKFLEFEPIRLSIGLDSVTFDAKAFIKAGNATIDVINRFDGGIYGINGGVRFNVNLDAVLVKGFDVINGGGHASLEIINGRFSFSGSLFVRIQVPKIHVATLPVPKIRVWKPKVWIEWVPVSVGPFTLLQLQANMSNTSVSSFFKVLEFGLRADYLYGGTPSIRPYSLDGSNTLEVFDYLIDDDGTYLGYVSVGSNLSVAAVPRVRGDGNGIVAMSSFINNEPIIEVERKTVRMYHPESPCEDCDEYTFPCLEYEDLVFEDWSKHYVVYPDDIANHTDDYALLITAPTTDIRITYSDGNPFILRYAANPIKGETVEEDLNIAGVNAVIISDGASELVQDDFEKPIDPIIIGPDDTYNTEAVTIMIRLPKQAGEWIVESPESFASSIIKVAPLPEIKEVSFDGTDTLSWNANGLDADKDVYVLEVRMSSDNGKDIANIDPGILIDEIIINNDYFVNGFANGTYKIDLNKIKDFESGEYFPRLVLHAVAKHAFIAAGNKITDDVTVMPRHAVTANVPLVHVNINEPAPVVSVTVSAGGSGALKVEWSATDSKASGYYMRVLGANGNPILTENDTFDENGEIAGTNLSQTVYDIPNSMGESGNFSVLLGGLAPGAMYQIEVVPYAKVPGETVDGEVLYSTIRGKSTLSNTTELPIPNTPVINMALPSSEVQTDGLGNRIIYVNSNFSFNLTSNQQCQLKVLQDGVVVYESGEYINSTTINITMDGLTMSAIQIIAINRGGDMAFSNFMVYLDDIAPPLFLVTDEESTIYANEDGQYVIKGYSVVGTAIYDDLGNKTVTDTNGEFALIGNLPQGADSSLRSVTAMSSTGNSMTSDILIVIKQTIMRGDVNGDGNINAADLSILLANFGKSGVAITNPAADLNDDGNVNAADLSILLANFGK